MTDPTHSAPSARPAPADDVAAPLQPVVTNDRATVAVGCVVWAVLLVLCLTDVEQLEADGRTWWLWTCVAGLVLGLGGLAFLRRKHLRGS